jgi:hypothetical protein
MHGTYLMDGKKASEFFSIDTVGGGDVDDMVGYSRQSGYISEMSLWMGRLILNNYISSWEFS